MGHQSRQRRNYISMERHQAMITAQLDHLRAIDAHLAKLLDIAAKRTLEVMQAALKASPNNPFLKGHVAALEGAI